MNGIEMGNILGNIAAGQQKSRSPETGNVRAARTIEEASVKYEKKAKETAGESGVFWTRGEKEGKNHSSWNYAGNHSGADRLKYRNNSLAQKGSEGTDKSDADPAIKETAPASQSGKKDQNAKNGIGQTENSSQTASASISSYGTRTNLSMVDRQRLAQQKKAKAKAKKKNLNYNRREVSSQVLRANKLGTAARALATARTKVATLRRSVGTGQYDENELRIAIAHAESIVKTAKKKLSNLKEEQFKEKRVSREKQANALKNQVKKQRVRVKRQQIKRELSAKRQQSERQMRAKELRVKQLKRRHRGEELADVAEADLKYIKDMDRYRRYGGAENSGRNTVDTTGTAALEIGDSAMRLSDLERAEQALKYEEEQMGQGAANFYDSSASGIDYAVSDGGSGADISSGASVSGGEISVDMGAAAVGGTVDISL